MKSAKSPFKFLDSYQQEDDDVFFGRDQETEDLYHALSGVKHLLVYGPSGAGKTSLIECGLRNQFSDADWFALSIRRDQNMIGSVFSSINKAIDKKIELDSRTNLPLDEKIDFGEAIEELFSEKYQPIYLLFDQFEELLILGTKEEKIDFFTRLNKLIRYKVPCRMILIMREEFIGHLSEFEHLCPSIFQHRFRLEKMGLSNVRDVIFNILEASRYQNDFQVENSEDLANKILAKLPDEQKEIELTHVQVFLSELWERAYQERKGQELPALKKELIKEEDKLEDVLERFLKKQIKELESTYPKNIPLEALAGMISKRNTKLQLSQSEIKKYLEENHVKLSFELPQLLQDLEERKIIRTLKAGDQTKHEISHDLLALAVGQNRTEEMKMREEADYTYKVLLGKQGYFSQDDLDFIRPFQRYKPYPTELKTKITKSETYLKTEQQDELNKTRTRLQLLSALLAFALVALVAAGYNYRNANEKTAEAQSNLAASYNTEIKRFESEIEVAKRDTASFNIYNAKQDVIKVRTDSIVSWEKRIKGLKNKINNLNLKK
jgi:GTPase SAR1 family protein